MTNIQDLPDEIMMEIFKYLNITDLCLSAKVSKSFRRISLDKKLWTSILIWPQYRRDRDAYRWNPPARCHVPPEFISFIIENGCTYLDLDLCKYQPWMGSDFPRANNLKFLKLSHGSVKEDQMYDDRNQQLFVDLIKSCHSLEKLGMFGLSLNGNILQAVV